MKITIIEPIGAKQNLLQAFQENLKKLGHELTSYDSRPENNAQIIERANDSDIIIASNLLIDSNVINACQNLKMISIAFTGYDHIDINTCNQKNIVVCNTPGYSTDSVAELTICLIISVLRKLIELEKKTRELSTREGFLGIELKGKTVGVIGTGTIGMRVIELLNAFGCNVVCYSRTKKPDLNYVELDELLKISDIVTLHLPLNDNTKHLINKDKLDLMKENAIIINTARGQIIDNNALADTILSKKILGAGLDTVDMEPPLPRNYKLLLTQNTVIMPHIGYATKEAINNRTNIVFGNVLSFLNGNILNKVN